MLFSCFSADLWSFSWIWAPIAGTDTKLEGVVWIVIPLPWQLNFKSHFTTWQACDWRCWSFSLTDGLYQAPNNQISQSETHGLSRWIAGCGTRSVTICGYARFNWPFQTPSLWPGGLIKKSTCSSVSYSHSQGSAILLDTPYTTGAHMKQQQRIIVSGLCETW